MTLTYFGHSAFQIETNGTTLLFDPFITGNKHAEGKISPDELSPDVILLTHAHGDHWGDTPDIAKRTGALVIGTYEVAQYIAREHGHENTHAMNTGGSYTFEWGRIKLTYARHSSSFPDGTYGGSPNGYLLEIEGKVIYNTGDTCPFSEMAWTGEDYDVDLMLTSIGDNFTQGPEDAVRSVRMVNPKLTVPLHYNTFPVIEIDMNRWTRAMKEASFETKVLGVGETLQL
jgi:L-ascorbate metabolism protein UlaG (beta-lactamase superfamily)